MWRHSTCSCLHSKVHVHGSSQRTKDEQGYLSLLTWIAVCERFWKLDSCDVAVAKGDGIVCIWVEPCSATGLLSSQHENGHVLVR